MNGKRLCTPVLMLLALLALLVVAPARSGHAQGPVGWLDLGWGYRRPVTVSNAGAAALTEYQVLVMLDSSFDFGRAEEDGSDLRVTDADGETELPFWVEEWDAVGETARIWVRVPSLAVGESTIYLYYGNPAAEPAGDGEATFELFDDDWSQLVGGPGNPVHTAGQLWWEATVSFPVVFEDTSFTGRPRFHMLYDGHDVIGHAKGYAWSSDLNTWSEHEANPIMGVGYAGDVPFAWGDVMKVGSTYYMYVSRGPGTIYRVESTDLITWTNFLPITGGSFGTGAAILKEGDGITPIEVDGRYWMVYFPGGGAGSMYLASTDAGGDLLAWEPWSGNPLLAPTAGGWDADGLWTPSFARLNDRYYIYYQGSGAGGWEIGYASAEAFDGGGSPIRPDAATWAKSDVDGDGDPDPVIEHGPGGSWDSTYCIDPMIREFDGTYYVFYTGNTTNGYAHSDSPEGPWTKYGEENGPSIWQVLGSPTVSEGILSLGSSSGLISLSRFQYHAVGYRANFASVGALVWGGFIDGSANDRTMIGTVREDSNLYLKNYVSAEATALLAGGLLGEYHVYEVLWGPGESTGVVDHGAFTGTLTTQVPSISLPVTFYNYEDTTNPLQVDWVFVRQYRDPEPETVIGAEEGNLLLSKAASADLVEVGASLVYTLTYHHTATDTLTSVLITDTLDANLAFTAASPAPTGGLPDAPYWSIGPLTGPITGHVVLTVSVTAPLPNGTVVTNTATIDSDETESYATYVTATVVAPTLWLVKRDEPGTVIAGAPLTYTLIYSNTGDATATGVVITDVLDSGVTFLGAVPEPTGGEGNVRYWGFSSLPPLAHGQILINVSVPVGLGDATLTNTATLGSLQTDSLSVIETTEVISHGTPVSVGLAPPATVVTAGQSVSFTLTTFDTFGNDWDVTDGGSFTVKPGAGGVWTANVYTSELAGNWIVTGTWAGLYSTATLTVQPGPLDHIAVSPDFASISAGEVQTYTAEAFDALGNSRGDVTAETVFDIAEPGHGGHWTDNLYTSNNPGNWTVIGTHGTVTDDAFLLVLGAVLDLDKTDGTASVEAGDLLTYTLSYANSGNVAVHDVVITDTLPNFVQSTGDCWVDSGTCESISADQFVFRIPEIAAQTAGQAGLSVQVSDPLPAGADLLVNWAWMAAPSLEEPLEAQDVDQIGTRPDLTVAVDHTPSLFSPGKRMTYTLTYGNAGRMHAEDVVISATLPPSTTYVGDGWSSSDGQTYTRTIGPVLADEASGTVTFTIQHPLGEPQQIGAPEFESTFTIAGAGGMANDASPEDNEVSATIGVPDLVVTDLVVDPLPPRPDEPVTFTLTLRNEGTAAAWNPDTQGGFFVDIFIAPVPSYPWVRYSEKDIFAAVAPIAPGAERVVVVTHGGFSLQELVEIQAFYAKVDNHHFYPYGLVPEFSEMNNVAGPVSPWSHYVYLPLITK
jgi:uncharacterized repeat protein (TIGR01451 family)